MQNLIAIGDLIIRSYELFKERFWVFFGLAALPMVFAAVLTWLLPDNMQQFNAAVVSIGIIMILLVAVLQILTSIGLLKAIDDVSAKKVVDYLREAMPVFFSFLWVSILAGIITIIGFLLLIVPGIIFSVYLAFSTFLVVLRGERGIEALKRSHSLVKGRWWGVAVRMLVIVLLAIAASVLIGSLSELFIALNGMWGEFFAGIINIVLQALLVPFTVAYMYFLFKSLEETYSPPAQPAEEAPTVESPGVV